MNSERTSLRLNKIHERFEAEIEMAEYLRYTDPETKTECIKLRKNVQQQSLYKDGKVLCVEAIKEEKKYPNGLTEFRIKWTNGTISWVPASEMPKSLIRNFRKKSPPTEAKVIVKPGKSPAKSIEKPGKSSAKSKRKSKTKKSPQKKVKSPQKKVQEQPPPPPVDEEIDFEVEKLLDRHVYESGQVFYLIKWKGYDHSANTWEPEDTMCCDDLIAEFEKSHNIGNHNTENNNTENHSTEQTDEVVLMDDAEDTNQVEATGEDKMNQLDEKEVTVEATVSETVRPSNNTSNNLNEKEEYYVNETSATVISEEETVPAKSKKSSPKKKKKGKKRRVISESSDSDEPLSKLNASSGIVVAVAEVDNDFKDTNKEEEPLTKEKSVQFKSEMVRVKQEEGQDIRILLRNESGKYQIADPSVCKSPSQDTVWPSPPQDTSVCPSPSEDTSVNPSPSMDTSVCPAPPQDTVSSSPSEDTAVSPPPSQDASVCPPPSQEEDQVPVEEEETATAPSSTNQDDNTNKNLEIFGAVKWNLKNWFLMRNCGSESNIMWILFDEAKSKYPSLVKAFNESRNMNC